MNFKALELTSQTIGEENSQYALCQNDIAEVYYRQGEYDKSLPYAQRSLEIKRRIFGREYFDNVVSLHNLATLYTRMGLYNEAIPLLQESLNISKKYFGEKLVYAFDLHPLAEVYTLMGDYEKALPLYHRSIEIQQQLQKEDGSDGRNVYYTGVLHSIAALYTRLGQYEKAIQLFKQTLVIKKDVYGIVSAEYAKTLNSYAEVCLLIGDDKTALTLQLQSLSIGRKLFGSKHPNIATGFYNLAMLYLSKKNFIKAEESCIEALRLQNTIYQRKHLDVAASLDLMGDIMKQRNQDKRALGFYERAFDMRKTIVTATHPAFIASLYNLGMIHDKMHNAGEAADLFLKADSAALVHIQQSYISLSEEEKLMYLRKAENQFNLLPSLLYQYKMSDRNIINRVYNNTVALKSIVLFHQQQVYNSIRNSSDERAITKYNRWRFNKALLGHQLTLTETARMKDFEKLRDSTTQMEEELSRISETFRNFKLQVIVNQQKIQERLQDGEAAVEFLKFRYYKNDWTDSVIYAALVLLPGKNDATFVSLFEEKRLKKLLRYSNNYGKAAINYLYPASENKTQVNNELYRTLWQPLEPMLKAVRTVYYAPVGLLNKISFAAIKTKNGKYLSDQYNLQQLLCTRSLLLKDDTAQNYTSASIWGNIDYDNSDSLELDSTSAELNYPARYWKKLPGTKTEMESIGSTLSVSHVQCRYASEADANEEQFKRMDGNSTSILHIATHGFFLPSSVYPLGAMFRSGLLLAGANKTWINRAARSGDDGIVTAYEISHLDLSKTQLVTLSACETAIGDIQDNEGVFGLQRAFKMAGVKQVLMSLWTVPDNETAELMKYFYGSLLQTHDAGKALREAQFSMKKKYSPYYWAGFVVTE